jgi:hypothetical protein
MNASFTKVINPGWQKPSWSKTSYRVFCKIEYKDGRLSITGVEGPNKFGNCQGGCGQINPVEVERLAYGWSRDLLRRFNEAWDKWHLNNMHAGCTHQDELGWDYSKDQSILSKPCPVCGYKWGTAWNTVPVPNDVLNFLKSLPDSEVAPAWV